jgi:DNA-binding Lrp family transcriptional regulator
VTEEDAQDVPIGITDLRLSGERSYLVAVVAERLQRLEDDGVVRGYRSDIDPRQLGYTQIASVSASPAMTAKSPPPTCVMSATPQTPRELQ